MPIFINKIIRLVRATFLFYHNRKLNKKYSSLDYVIKSTESFSQQLYEANINVRELEHQVGRYLNMKKVCDDIKLNNIEGDFVEFGTWQGLGLILLSKCLNDDVNNRKLIGIDSFEGLPEHSTIWKKGDFGNTTEDVAKSNIISNIKNKDKLSLNLIKGWFNDRVVKNELYAICQNIALIHFDSDLKSSTLQALYMIQPYLERRKEPIYFLFDDWGCHPDEVPDAFSSWYENARTTYNMKAEKIFTTKLTRYYKVTFNCEGDI